MSWSIRGIEQIRLARDLAFLLSAALFAAAAIAATQEPIPTISFAWAEEDSEQAAR